MLDWFKKQWRIIEGDAKFYILLAVLGLAMSGVVIPSITTTALSRAHEGALGWGNLR